MLESAQKLAFCAVAGCTTRWHRVVKNMVKMVFMAALVGISVFRAIDELVLLTPERTYNTCKQSCREAIDRSIVLYNFRG